ncbi:MAG: hypothetical protein US69_C0017G0001, partial [candidate division TM6 bacterium GW2011_GWF2_38_10]
KDSHEKSKRKLEEERNENETSLTKEEMFKPVISSRVFQLELPQPSESVHLVLNENEVGEMKKKCAKVNSTPKPRKPSVIDQLRKLEKEKQEEITNFEKIITKAKQTNQNDLEIIGPKKQLAKARSELKKIQLEMKEMLL